MPWGRNAFGLRRQKKRTYSVIRENDETNGDEFRVIVTSLPTLKRLSFKKKLNGVQSPPIRNETQVDTPAFQFILVETVSGLQNRKTTERETRIEEKLTRRNRTPVNEVTRESYYSYQA